MNNTFPPKILPPPGPGLLALVKVGFALKGTTYTQWAEEEGINRRVVASAITGARNGPLSRRIRRQVLVAAGVIASDTKLPLRWK